ncbi:MAG: DUF3100 domain-containing protein [Tissierellia bacterium]|nr:DUF3100 domain-containing protein [Tissierellia bacterium]
MINIKRDFLFHISVLIVAVISMLIGSKSLNIGGITIVFSPLIWAMILVFILYKSPFKYINTKNSEISNYMMGIMLSVLIAKLGVTSGSQLEEMKKAGVALVLQNFGNLGTILISLPIAMILGLKRESIGMCHALSREANVGLIQDNYGANSPEFRGVMAVYIIGTILGPIIMSVISSITISLGIITPLAAAMGTGAGSASMMTAGISALIANYPELESQMLAYGGLSNLISSVIALPLGIFIGLPLTEFLYKKIKREKKNEGIQTKNN